ncbi:hypothetical protein C8J56DRAFT_13908 [Mycena floridula]|nr:hypothetical protein C8J56DRAFT_13908 [Mycena floridula]
MPNQHDMGKAAPALLDVWIYFNLLGNTIALPILVATILLSKRVRRHRHPTLLNVIITWILGGIFGLLLFYAGKHKPNTPEPPRALCIAQTSLLFGITPMWSVAILVMLYHIISSIRGNVASRLKMILMLSAPYIVQFAFSIATLVVALRNPNKVNRHRRFFYCALKNRPLSDTMEVFTFVVCLGIVALEIQLAVIFYRYWKGLKSVGRTKNIIDTQLVIRVLVFGIYVFFGMIVNVLTIFNKHTLAPDMCAATIGTAIFFVFGSQADILRVWCFWRKPPPTKIIGSPAHAFDIEAPLPCTPEKAYFVISLVPPAPPPKD